jgi:hypothetical protein
MVLVLVFPLCDAGLILFCYLDPFSVVVGAALVFPLDLVLVRFLFDQFFPLLVRRRSCFLSSFLPSHLFGVDLLVMSESIAPVCVTRS